MVVAFIALVLSVAMGQSIPLDPRYRVGYPQAPPPLLPSTPAVGTADGETMQLPLAQGWNVITLPFSSLRKAEGFTRAWLEIEASRYVAVDPVHSPGTIDCGRAYIAYVTRIGYRTGTGRVQIAAGKTRTLLVELPPAGGGSGGTKSVEQSTRMRVAGYPFTYDGRRYRVKKILAWEYGNQNRHWENTWWTDTGDTCVELACDPVYMGRSYRVIVTWVDKLGNERSGGGYPEIWAHDQRVTYEHP